jgi:outer membrane cobalamin receptor
MEVLRNVPGFEFGLDVEGVVGLGIRGNWAHEGKVVLFIDGQEMNESLYSTLQFGNHYPVEHIDRIEIIRGPGSALHGGFAAYAVINIITRTPKSGNYPDLI